MITFFLLDKNKDMWHTGFFPVFKLWNTVKGYMGQNNLTKSKKIKFQKQHKIQLLPLHLFLSEVRNSVWWGLGLKITKCCSTEHLLHSIELFYSAPAILLVNIQPNSLVRLWICNPISSFGLLWVSLRWIISACLQGLQFLEKC